MSERTRKSKYNGIPLTRREYIAFHDRMLRVCVKQKSCVVVAVAVKLLNLSRELGYSYCSAEKLATEMLGVHRNSVNSAIQWLEQAGLFRQVTTKGRVNCYAPVLLPDEVQPSAEQAMEGRLRFSRRDKEGVIIDQATGHIYDSEDLKENSTW